MLALTRSFDCESLCNPRVRACRFSGAAKVRSVRLEHPIRFRRVRSRDIDRSIEKVPRGAGEVDRHEPWEA